MSWHIDTPTAQRYTERRLDPVGSASVEAHLDRCAACRAMVSDTLTSDDGDVLDAVWANLTERLDEPRLGWIETALRRVGVGDVTARIVAATQRARGSYVAAVALSVLLAVVASRSSYDGFFATFLVVSPLGPLVVTASAFSRWCDPVGELGATVPTSALRTLLVRTAAAVAPAIVLTGLSVPWLLDRGWLAVGWLLPSLALVIATVALSSWTSIEAAATTVGGTWLAVLVGIRVRVRVPELVDVLTGPAQIGSLVVVAAGAAVILVRRSAYDYREL